jgi:aspartyl/asparaginyl-tRNA synthetase
LLLSAWLADWEWVVILLVWGSLSLGSAVRCEGTLVRKPSPHNGFELHATTVNVLGPCDTKVRKHFANEYWP